MTNGVKQSLALVAVLALPLPLLAQDGKVIYRDRGAKGVSSTTGKIESESIAGIRISGKTISSADVVDVQYEVPAVVRLDYNSVATIETTRPIEALKGYEALVRTAAVQNNKYLKRQIEFKITFLTAARVDEGLELHQKAVATLEKFKKENADSWQMVPVARTLGRLLLEREPPDLDAARKCYDDVGRAVGVPPEVREEFTFLTIDMLLRAGRLAEANRRLETISAENARVSLYRICAQATPANLPEAFRRLEQFIDKTTDPLLKATAYNVLGDCYRRDPTRKKDALYAHLWVDVIYNQDPIELNKAVGRLAELFAELKDEERAKLYRERLRGK